MNHKITFVIGGCRSGKSHFALSQANAVCGSRNVFIATSVPADDEMEKRVQTHQKERGSDWITCEEPVNIHQAIDQHSARSEVLLVDCLTLWVSNLMLAGEKTRQIEHRMLQLEKSLFNSRCPVFLVSNEVGMGIVPENMLARQFRDMAGMVNQRVAAVADRVVMTVAGIAVQIKPSQA